MEPISSGFRMHTVMCSHPALFAIKFKLYDLILFLNSESFTNFLIGHFREIMIT